MTIVKVCGLTRAEDVDAALDSGADWLGFIHVPQTPRYVERPLLERLSARAAGRATRVIVVQNAAPSLLEDLRKNLDFEYFQFHGREPLDFVDRYKGYKVFHIRDGAPPAEELKAHGPPFLLDTQVGSRRGGTGRPFDWSILPAVAGPYLVAGGLEPDNVAELVSRYRPWGVDVSSGVERERRAKDHDKLKRFIDNVRRARNERYSL